jgi:hypothetical protein
MKGWKNFQVILTVADGRKYTVTVRATHRGMAIFVAKRDHPSAVSAEIA